MSRPLVLLALVTLVLAGCAPDAPPSHPRDAGWPELPATVTVDEAAPPLPGRGPIGRGALLLGSFPYRSGGDYLVLTDGRQFRLPDPPLGEGRLGWTAATLSPDGWWLGYRTMRFTGDRGYQLRSLANGHVITANGTSLRWSVDSRWLLLWDSASTVPNDFTVIDLTTGDTLPATAMAYLSARILPTGEALFVTADATTLRIQTADNVPVLVTLAEREDDACWCVLQDAVQSPDGDRVTVSLGFRDGLAPGTDVVQVAEWTGAAATVLVLDRETGAEVGRGSLTPPDAEYIHLVADRGPNLLFLVGSRGEGQRLVAFDPRSGAQSVVTTGPPGWSLIAPGEHTLAPDG